MKKLSYAKITHGSVMGHKFVLLFLLISEVASGEASIKNLQMLPGETISVQYPNGSEVKVSRKGVVDVFATSQTDWQLTALRGGLVIVDAIDGSGTPQLPRLVIDVKSAAAPDRFPVATSIPDWICLKTGISCEQDPGIVAGTVTDFRWYLSTRSWCHTSRNCRLYTTLSEKAKSELKAYIRARLPSDMEVTVTIQGDISVTALCDPLTPEHHLKAIETAFPRMLDSKTLGFNCLVNQSAFRVTVKARKVSSSTGRTIGYDRDLDFSITNKPFLHTTTVFKNDLKNEEITTESEILGQPTFLATANIEFASLIGGELPYRSDSSQNSEEYRWKEYGLSIKGTIKSVQGETIRSAIEVFLKSVHDQPSKGLNTSSIKSNFETTAGQWTMIGELDLNSALSSASRTVFLASIPIIGPLFRLDQTATSNSKLQTWIKIESAGSPISNLNDDIELQALPAK